MSPLTQLNHAQLGSSTAAASTSHDDALVHSLSAGELAVLDEEACDRISNTRIPGPPTPMAGNKTPAPVLSIDPKPNIAAGDILVSPSIANTPLKQTTAGAIAGSDNSSNDRKVSLPIAAAGQAQPTTLNRKPSGEKASTGRRMSIGSDSSTHNNLSSTFSGGKGQAPTRAREEETLKAILQVGKRTNEVCVICDGCFVLSVKNLG